MNDQYFAGLFDGEGSIRITRLKLPGKDHVRYALYGAIGMCHRPIIEAVHREYGGHIYCIQPKMKNSRTHFDVRWGSQMAATMLRRIQPYVIVKKEEVDLALKFQAHIDDNPYNPGGRGFRVNREKIVATRELFFQKITALKKRAYPLFTS